MVELLQQSRPFFRSQQLSLSEVGRVQGLDQLGLTRIRGPNFKGNNDAELVDAFAWEESRELRHGVFFHVQIL